MTGGVLPSICRGSGDVRTMLWNALLYASQHPRCTPSNFNRPKDIYGRFAAPEEFAPTAFLVLLLLFWRFQLRVCGCGWVGVV